MLAMKKLMKSLVHSLHSGKAAVERYFHLFLRLYKLMKSDFYLIEIHKSRTLKVFRLLD